jgi:MraZ protein
MIVRLEEKVAEVSFGDTQGQMVLAKLFSKADTFSCDNKGRIKIEERLLKYAQIQSEAVFIGGGSTFNIWEPENFRNYLAKESQEDAASVLRGLGL